MTKKQVRVNWLGHRMSAAAAIREGVLIDARVYDVWAGLYRQWLINGIGQFHKV